MGVPIGVGASLMIAGYLGPAIGWRNCFYALGAIGLCLAIVMLFVKETPRRQQLQAPTAERPKLKEIFATAFRALGNCPALALTMAGGVALHFILGAAAFDQLWFVQERGFDRAWIAQTTGWIAVIGGVLGNLFGGAGSDWYYRKTGNGRAMFLFWIMLLLAPINVVYRLVPPDSIWFWAGVFFGFFQLGCFYGPTFSSVQELVPPHIRATVVAFYILMLNLIGLGFGITAGGISIDMMKGAGYEEPYTWTLVVFTLISLLAIPLFFLAGRRFEGDRARLEALEAARSAG
jgi:MFS family permease